MRSYFIHPIRLGGDNRFQASHALDLNNIFLNISNKYLYRRLINNRNNAYFDENKASYGLQPFSEHFEALRRNDGIEIDLSPFVNVENNNTSNCSLPVQFAALYIFEYGDCVVLFSTQTPTEYSCEDIPVAESYRKIYDDVLSNEVLNIFRDFSQALGMSIEIDDETPIHTVYSINSDQLSKKFFNDCFSKEGLSLEECEIRFFKSVSKSVYRGWSVSIIKDSNISEEFYITGMLVRVQLMWFSVRRMRSRLNLMNLENLGSYSMSKLQHREQEIIENSAYFSSISFYMSDYSANLKPWLSAVFNQYDKMWKLEEDLIEISSGFQSISQINLFYLSKKRDRQSSFQSALLFVIALFDTLALSGYVFAFTEYSKSNEVTQGLFSFLLNENFILLIFTLNVGMFVFLVMFSILFKVMR